MSVTAETKARAAATRARNATRKAAYLAEQARLNAKLVKVQTFAADARGNANVRAAAIETAAKLQNTLDRGNIPRTVVEWKASRKRNGMGGTIPPLGKALS